MVNIFREWFHDLWLDLFGPWDREDCADLNCEFCGRGPIAPTDWGSCSSCFFGDTPSDLNPLHANGEHYHG